MAIRANQRALEKLLSALAWQKQLLLRLIELDPVSTALVDQLDICQRRIVGVSATLVALSISLSPDVVSRLGVQTPDRVF